MLEQFPEGFRKMLLEGKSLEPRQMAEFLFQSFYSGEDGDKPFIAGQELLGSRLSFLSRLLPDSKREFEGTGPNLLPDILKYYMGKMARNGVLLNGVGLVGSVRAQEICEWLLVNGAEIVHNPGNLALKNLIISKIEELLITVEEPINSAVKDYVGSSFDHIGKNIPGAVLEFSNTEDLFLQGDIWFEFIKQKDGRYTLCLYTSGHGLNYHPAAQEVGARKFCLKLENIDSEHLNLQFFKGLVQRNWESLWNKDFSSTARDVYHTILGSLHGTLAEDPMVRIRNSKIFNLPSGQLYKLPEIRVNPLLLMELQPGEGHTGFSTVMHLLMKKKGPKEHLVFEMLWEHLVDFCREKCVTGEYIEISEENKVILEPLLKNVIASYARIKNQPTYKQRSGEIELVLADLHKAFEYHTKVKAPKNDATSAVSTMEDKIRDKLADLGLTTGKLLQIESMLEWFLGEGVKPVIHPLVSELIKVLPEGVEKVEKKEGAQVKVKRGDVPGSYATLYLDFGWKLANMLMLVSGYAAGGAWTALSIPTLLTLLPYVLPEKYYRYYQEAMVAFRYAVAKMLFQVCWNYLFPEKTKQNFIGLQKLIFEKMSLVNQPQPTRPFLSVEKKIDVEPPEEVKIAPHVSTGANFKYPGWLIAGRMGALVYKNLNDTQTDWSHPENLEELISMVKSGTTWLSIYNLIFTQKRLEDRIKDFSKLSDPRLVLEQLLRLHSALLETKPIIKNRYAMLYLVLFAGQILKQQNGSLIIDPSVWKEYKLLVENGLEWLQKLTPGELGGIYDIDSSNFNHGYLEQSQKVFRMAGLTHDTRSQKEITVLHEHRKLTELLKEASKHFYTTTFHIVDDYFGYEGRDVLEFFSWVPRNLVGTPTGSGVIDILAAIMDIAESKVPNKNFYKLIRSLPLPTPGSEWERLENIDGVIKILETIISKIQYGALDQFDDYVCKDTNEIASNVNKVLSVYRILPILTCLIKRQYLEKESSFPFKSTRYFKWDVTIDYYYLLQYAIEHSNYLRDPKDSEELDSLLKFLLPHVDIKNPPKKDQILNWRTGTGVFPGITTLFFFNLQEELRKRNPQHADCEDKSESAQSNYKVMKEYKRFLGACVHTAKTVSELRDPDETLSDYSRILSEYEPARRPCPEEVNPLLPKKRQNELVGSAEKAVHRDATLMGVEGSAMVSAIIAYYIQYPEAYLNENFWTTGYNKLASVLFRPGLLKEAIAHNPQIIDRLCDMLLNIFELMVIRSKNPIFSERLRMVMRLWINLAQSCEQYCEFYEPGSRQKFQFIDEWITEFKKYRHCEAVLNTFIVEMEMERIPVDPSTVSDPKVILKSLRVLLTGVIFHGKLIEQGKWALWGTELAELFQSEETTIRDQVLVEVYREQGYPEPMARDLIGRLEYSVDKDLILRIREVDANKRTLHLPYKAYERLQGVVGYQTFRSLEFVDRYTLQTRDGKTQYRIKPGANGFHNFDDISCSLYRTMENGDGTYSEFRPVEIRWDKCGKNFGNIDKLLKSKMPEGRTIEENSVEIWVEVFEDDFNDEKIEETRDWQRQVLISAISSENWDRYDDIRMNMTHNTLKDMLYGSLSSVIENEDEPIQSSTVPFGNEALYGGGADLSDEEVPIDVIKRKVSSLIEQFRWGDVKHWIEKIYFSDSLAVSKQLPLEAVRESTVPQFHVDGLLKPYSGFCAVSEVSVIAKNDSHIPAGIKFNPYDLTFDVEKDAEGAVRLNSVEYPGYFISKDQYHETISGIPHTLVLETESGKKRVLVHAKESFMNLANVWTRLDVVAGTMVKSLSDKIAGNFKAEGPRVHYVFDIEVNETGTSKLVSGDQKGLAFLLVHHLYRLDFAAAEEPCAEIERLFRHQPVPKNYWPEIHLLLMPGEVPEMAQYRWRVVSARQMNKSLHPVWETNQESQKPEKNFFDHALTTMVLLDLISFMNKEDVRNHVTAHQEYFLYKCMIDLVVEFVSSSVDRSNQLCGIFNREFIETLLEFPPFDQSPLINRYIELKEIFEVTESGSRRTLVKWVTRFLMTPADLPEIRGKASQYTPEPTLRDNNVIKGIFNLRKMQTMFHKKTAGLDLIRLVREISRWEFGPLKVDFDDFKVQTVKSHFIYYYHLLRSDQISDIDPSGKLKEKLKEVLGRYKGLGDKHTQYLTEILIQLGQIPGSYPTTLELSEAHERGLHGGAEGFKHWEEFVSNLCHHLLVQDVCSSVLAPVLGWGMIKISTDNLVGGLISPLLETGEGIATTLRNLSAEKAKTHISYLLTLASQKYVDRITVLIAGKVRGAKPKHLALGAGAVALTTYAASWMAGSMISTAVQAKIDDYNEENESSPSQWMQTLAPLVPVALVGVNALAAWMKTRRVRVADMLPFRWAIGLEVAVKGGKTVYALYNEHQKVEKARQERAKSIDFSLSALQEQEVAINGFLDDMFRLAYTSELISGHDKSQVKIEPLDESKAETPFEKERFSRVNKSIEEFYANAAKEREIYKLKNFPEFIAMFNQLQFFRQMLCQIVEREKKELQNVLKMNFAQIEKCVDNREAIPFDKMTGLTEKQRPLIKLALARIYLLDSRIKQIQDILKLGEALNKVSKRRDPERYYFFADKIASSLRTRTTYDFATTSPRLAFVSAQFEAATGKKLWERQSQKLALTQEADCILDLPPGDGKTAAIIPVTIADKGDGEHLVMPIFPKQLAGDNMRTVHMQSHQVFNRLTYRFKFNRDLPLDNSTLRDILVIANGAVRHGEPIQMTKEDAQALRSIFVERLYEYGQQSVLGQIRDHFKLIKDEKKRGLILLHSILRVMYTKGIAIADETHETYAHRKQLNYPLGQAVSLDQEYSRIIEAVFGQAVKCPELLQAFVNNETCFFDMERYNAVHKRSIAEALSNWKLLGIHGRDEFEIAVRKKEFIGFVCENIDYIPSWMPKDMALFRRISLIKGLLNDLLPRCFKSRSGVNFGRKEGDKTEFARPSDGNNGASTTDTIKNPFEAYVKTILMLFDRGLNSEQYERVLKKLKRLTAREMDKEKLPFEQTSIHRQFPEITLDVLNNKDETKRIEIYETLKKNPQFCLLYIRYFVRKEIVYWKQNIENNSQDFASMFASQISCTGTPYNDGTYPAWMRMLRDPTTIGELLDIIARKCKGVAVLHKTRPLEVLREIIATYFSPQTGFSALIDGGALFTGLSNKEVATAMMNYCQNVRRDIEAVKFYMEDEHGSEQLYCLTRSGDKPILASQVSVPLEKCLTYYDQRHGFGADVKQNGDGLETMGPNHPLFKWLQELFRIRELKKDTKLMPWNDVVVKEHKIQIVMTKEVQRLILDQEAPEHIPTLTEIVEYALRNEAAIAKEENYPSLLSKMRQVPSKAIYGKIMRTPSEKVDTWYPLFEEFQSYFISKVQDDPALLFGHVKKEVEITEALESARCRNMDLILSSVSLNGDERAAVNEELKDLPLPVLEEKVMIAVGPDGLMNEEASLAFGMEQTVELSVDQKQEVEQNEEVEQQQEQEQDLNQELNVNAQGRNNNRYYYNDLPWPADFDPTVMSSFKFETSAEMKRDFWGRSIVTCPLFKVQSLFAVAKNPLLRQCTPHFDSRLWMTNNFTPRHVRGYSETAIDIADKHQLALTHVIVHFEMENGTPKIWQMGALSVHDAAFLQGRFIRSRMNWESRNTKADKKMRTVIWNTKLGLLEAGALAYQNILSMNEEFKTLVAQLKILDGQTDFGDDAPLLTKWFTQNNNGKFFEGIEEIVKSRGNVFKGTRLDKLCRNVDTSFTLIDMM
jgi:hypothetical protein